jgi:hypothetical protein
MAMRSALLPVLLAGALSVPAARADAQFDATVCRIFDPAGVKLLTQVWKAADGSCMTNKLDGGIRPCKDGQAGLYERLRSMGQGYGGALHDSYETKVAKKFRDPYVLNVRHRHALEDPRLRPMLSLKAAGPGCPAILDPVLAGRDEQARNDPWWIHLNNQIYARLIHDKLITHGIDRFVPYDANAVLRAPASAARPGGAPVTEETAKSVREPAPAGSIRGLFTGAAENRI